MIRSCLYRKFVFSLAVLILASVAVIGIHHHDDGSFHSDCPICITGGFLSFTNLPDTATFSVLSLVSSTDLPAEENHAILTAISTCLNRAPPRILS